MKLASTSNGLCALCGADLSPARITFSTDLGTGILVVRNVPARICNRCGSEWLDDATVADLERKTEDVRQRGTQIEVLALP